MKPGENNQIVRLNQDGEEEAIRELNHELASVYKSLRKQHRVTAYFIFFIFVFIFLEFIFQNIIQEIEIDFLIGVQKKLDISKESMEFWKTWLFLGNRKMMIFSMITIFTFTYYFISATMTLKVATVSYYVIFFFASLNVLYAEPEPFWQSEEIFSSLCPGYFASPSVFSVYLIFIAGYWELLFRESQMQLPACRRSRVKRVILRVIVVLTWVVLVLESFLRYLDGEIFLSQILVTYFYLLVSFGCVSFFSKQISSFTELCTEPNGNQKTFVFLNIIIVAASQFVVFVIISLRLDNNPNDVSPSQVDQLMICLTSQEEGNDLKYQSVAQLIGSWISLDLTQCIFSQLGTAAGAAMAFSSFTNPNKWADAPLWSRALAFVISVFVNSPVAIYSSTNISTVFTLSRYTGFDLFFFAVCWFVFGGIPLLFKKLKLFQNPEEDATQSISLSVQSSDRVTFKTDQSKTSLDEPAKTE